MSRLDELSGELTLHSHDTNKLARLINLVRLLGTTGRALPQEEISDILGEDLQTVASDLRELRQAGYPVVFDATTESYFILDQGSISSASPHSPSDVIAAVTALMLLRVNPRLTAAVERACQQLMNHLDVQTRKWFEAVLRGIQVVSYDSQHSAQFEHLLQLANALLFKKHVKLTFESPNSADIETLFSPYRIQICFPHWLIEGRSRTHGAVISLNLAQVKSVEITDESYLTPVAQWRAESAPSQQQFPPGTTFVVLQMQPNTSLKSEPFAAHDMTVQPVAGTSDQITVSFRTSSLTEVANWIWQQENAISVVQPPMLRQLLSARANQILNRMRSDRLP